MTNLPIVVTGANGQLGEALKEQYPEANFTDRHELDITDQRMVSAFKWPQGGVIINAAAFTNVDAAETSEGRKLAWQVNARAVAHLAWAATKNSMTLVHISSDYVFDGTLSPHNEDEALTPLGSYGASKAAGDIAAASIASHYILRTSWVIGEGKNFVRTMLDLGKQGKSPTVVSDQTGRPTFTSELVRAIDHLLTAKADFGTYNVTNEGDIVSWAELTRKIFQIAEFSGLTVTDTTTEEYFASKPGVAPRPLQSALDLSKIQGTGFVSREWQEDLRIYIKGDQA
jgi:dTDP-4-dehydrorhamnose 3,5-epimerase/reductase